jgi:hypothetical protein
MAFHQRRYFAAVARTGNFTRVATACRVSQPSSVGFGVLTMPPDRTIYAPYPIEDEAHVDERRREVGLGPLAEYMVQLNQQNPLGPK